MGVELDPLGNGGTGMYLSVLDGITLGANVDVGGANVGRSTLTGRAAGAAVCLNNASNCNSSG